MNDQNACDHCFAPVSNSSARLLILGSYPGVTSLAQSQYYAHPRNMFWDIMSELIQFNRGLDYQKRISALQAAGIALWDVLYSCKRAGSLDAKIVSPSIVINDFENFFQIHPLIRTIVFNGAKAEQEFNKRVVPVAVQMIGSKQCLRVPSTSPAMASMSYREKVQRWRLILDHL